MKQYLYFLFIAIPFLSLSCKDEWKDELYSQMISLKAPIDSLGVTNVYLRYSADGIKEFDLPVVVSGSQYNDRNLTVHVGVDNDTLAVLNNERFLHRKDLYFRQLPSEFYELVSPTCFIPAGSSLANYKIRFNLANLDMVESWVLPLTIKDHPSYVANKRNGWRKALLNIVPFNDYSGQYSATGMNVYFDKGIGNPIVVDTRTAHVVDEKRIFFYAGMVDEFAEDRAAYKIIVEFGEPQVDIDGVLFGELIVKSVNPAINFELIEDPIYAISEVPDETLPYLMRKQIILDLKYKYNDITTTPGFPVRYRAEGSMTMERERNTLIPDEEQAILW